MTPVPFHVSANGKNITLRVPELRFPGDGEGGPGTPFITVAMNAGPIPGVPSETSVLYLPVRTLPTPPGLGFLIPGDNSVLVTWDGFQFDGGSPVTGYRVRAYSGNRVVATVVTGLTTSVVVTGLRNGTPYTFDVSSINAVGTGFASPRSGPVTPIGG